MKIELNGPAAAQLPAERSSKQVANTNTVNTQIEAEDRTTLRSDPSSVRALTNQALNSPEIRQPLVDNLRQSVSTEQYQYNATRTAAAIVGHDVG